MQRHRIVSLLLLLLFTVAVAAMASDQPSQGVPVIGAVNPDNGKPGDLVTATGDYLDKARVAEVFLSAANKDIKVEILEQTAAAIKFKIPAEATAGRYGLTVLMAGGDPILLEQPVVLVVKAIKAAR